MFHKLSEEVSKISEAEYKFLKKRKCLRVVQVNYWPGVCFDCSNLQG